MGECIEREALIEKLRTMPIPKQAGRANTWLDNCAAGVNAAIWEVASFPAADVAPVVHGLWEKEPSSFWRWTPSGAVAVARTTYRCGLCGRGTAVKSNYCPNCGAKMDGGADHEAD